MRGWGRPAKQSNTDVESTGQFFFSCEVVEVEPGKLLIQAKPPVWNDNLRPSDSLLD